MFSRRSLATLLIAVGIYATALEVFLIAGAALAYTKEEEVELDRTAPRTERRLLLTESVRTRDMAMACAPFCGSWVLGLWLLRRRRRGI